MKKCVVCLIIVVFISESLYTKRRQAEKPTQHRLIRHGFDSLLVLFRYLMDTMKQINTKMTDNRFSGGGLEVADKQAGEARGSGLAGRLKLLVCSLTTIGFRPDSRTINSQCDPWCSVHGLPPDKATHPDILQLEVRQGGYCRGESESNAMEKETRQGMD